MPNVSSQVKISAPRHFLESKWFERYQQLTMPPDALAQVLRPVLQLLAQRKSESDVAPLRISALIFAGDHGVVQNHPVSAFPQAVTAQMLINFLTGGAAMSVLCAARSAPLYVCDVGVATAYPSEGLQTKKHVTFFDRNLVRSAAGEYPHGAKDLSLEPALTSDMFTAAFAVGKEIFNQVYAKDQPDAVILGEMGIGNTTSAAALISYLLDMPPSVVVGAGTGISNEQKVTKVRVVEKAIERYRNSDSCFSPESTLANLGGFELAAMAGAACEAVSKGVHILLDGVIVTAALLPFALAQKEFSEWFISCHQSAEPAHQHALAEMGLTPLLSLSLRLGEGSGAALAAGMLQDGFKLLSEMATFQQAGVSQA
jgi:nicotinate-nucleotide--dimethylbenzimidazole phosphoribosyltransferase